jgi:hypothetical protein
MQMHDALRRAQGASATDALVVSFDIAPAQAQAILRTVAPHFAWALETRSLSRGGLADLVEAVGRVDRAKYPAGANVFRDEAARAEGEAALALLVPSAEARDLFATDVAGKTGLERSMVAGMLPGLALLTLSVLAARSKSTLDALLAQMPSLGRWSKGSAHADLADILRRSCGGGPYAKRALRRVTRRRLARAGGFGGMGVIGWYLRYMLLRPAKRLARPIAGQVMRQA